ncbi:hypothetical protein PybrP1_006291 [[Pythium] brassicae (nom. inval.)]|nr:hypothetical protein PybrP1_006291 [[Pythium] brassicae (nom. inval.)]
MPSLASATASLALALALASPAARAANCTTTEATAIAALDRVLEDNFECGRLNSLVPGEVTTLQVCSDAACVRLVKKAAASVPDCLINGESAQRISLVAFKSCSVSDETPTTAPAPTTAATPGPTTKAPSSPSGGSVAGEGESKTTAPTPTTAAPKSAAAGAAVSTVVVVCAASLLLSSWM